MRMSVLTVTATPAGAALVFGSGATAVNAAKPTQKSSTNDIQVTSVIDDVDQALGRPYLVSSDGAPYASTSDGLVTSILQGSVNGQTEWRLDTYALATSRGKTVIKRSNRTVSFQFSEAAGDNVPPPDLTGVVTAHVHMFANCGGSFVTMAAGSSQQCPGAFRIEPINDGDRSYRLAFQPENYPEVTRMQVICTSADTAGCAAWTVAPGDGTAGSLVGSDGLPRSLNQLLLLVGTTETVAQALGDYYLSFNVHVSR